MSTDVPKTDDLPDEKPPEKPPAETAPKSIDDDWAAADESAMDKLLESTAPPAAEENSEDPGS